MADFDANLLVGALLMSVSQETDLLGTGDDCLHIHAHFVLASSLSLEVHGVVHHLVVEGAGVGHAANIREITTHIILLFISSK